MPQPSSLTPTMIALAFPAAAAVILTALRPRLRPDLRAGPRLSFAELFWCWGQPSLGGLVRLQFLLARKPLDDSRTDDVQVDVARTVENVLPSSTSMQVAGCLTPGMVERHAIVGRPLTAPGRSP